MRPGHWLALTLATASLAAACGRAPHGGPAPTPSASAGAPVTLRIARIEAPAEAAPGREARVIVTVVLPNACTELTAVDAAFAGDRLTFTARGTQAQDAVCTQVLTFRPVEVPVTPLSPGAYTLVSADGEAATTMSVR